ncbi:MAG: DUF4382 domain-containing protein [Desulfobacterales bacterium]
MMKIFEIKKLIYLAVILLVFSACAGDDSDSSTTEINLSRTGTLSLVLTDASTEDYKAVYITIKEVQVHSGNEENEGWVVAATPDATYNLLKLVNGIIKQLGIRELEAGHYTQLRMIIGNTADDGTNINGESHPFANYIIDQSDACKELKIPSGYQTGVKIVHGFDIAENQLTELILDFDASTSVVKAGNSGQWILKPTIKVIDRLVSASISGIISDADTNPLEGVMVSAQVYDSNAEDIQYQIIGHGRGISEADGYYFMYLWPGTYNIVLYKEGHRTECRHIEVESGISSDQNFTVETTETGTIEGEVTIEDADENQTAFLSFRTNALCEGYAEEPIEIISKSIAEGGSFSVQLPPGTYRLVASTEGRASRTYDNIEVTSSTITTRDVIFETQ